MKKSNAFTMKCQFCNSKLYCFICNKINVIKHEHLCHCYCCDVEFCLHSETNSINALVFYIENGSILYNTVDIKTLFLDDFENILIVLDKNLNITPHNVSKIFNRYCRTLLLK